LEFCGGKEARALKAIKGAVGADNIYDLLSISAGD